MKTYNLDELYPKYNDPEFINHAKENLLDLMSGENKTLLSELYRLCDAEGKKGRRGRLRRLPFFIYWLSASICDFWGSGNFFESLKGNIGLKERQVDEILEVLDKLMNDSDLYRYFNDKGITYSDISRIVYRRNSQKNAIVERKILEGLNLSEFSRMINIPVLPPDWDTLNETDKSKLERFFEIKNILLQIIKSEGVVIQSELRKNKRIFRKMKKETFEWFVKGLEEDGKIIVKKLGKRRFLIYGKS